MLKRLLWFVLSIVVAVLLFFVLIMIIPIKTKTAEKVELTYIFIDDDGTEYDIFDKAHGAAKDWSFLFRPRTWDNEVISSWNTISETWVVNSDYDMLTWNILTGDTLTWDILNQNTWEDDILEQDTGNQNILTWNLEDEDNLEENSLPNTPYTTRDEATWDENLLTGMDLTDTVDTELDTWWNVNNKTWDKWNVLWTKDYIWEDENNTSWSNILLTGSDLTWEKNNITWTVVLLWDKELPLEDTWFNLPEWAVEKPLPKDCKTPWWITIKHNESVLAYQQRTDVPDICNVQRRTCIDWELNWSFLQPSCDESVSYVYTNKTNNLQNESSNVVVYTKKEVVSKNPKDPDSLVQNPRYAKNDAAEFDKNWKIKSTGTPITDWDENWDEWEYADRESVEQINFDYYNCRSPWWELIQHGQFVKAYEFPYGFTNSNCKTELRLCVDGELKWSYKYKDCEYIEMTYEEYNNLWEIDDDLFIWWEHQITDKEKKWFWNRLKNLFK